MTIPEACSLVLKAGGVGVNGETYLLDMGEPVKIYDVAEQLIRFMGYEPGKDISISIIGPRPGERNNEPLWSSNEEPVKTEFPRILKLVQKEKPVLQETSELLQSLKDCCIFFAPERKTLPRQGNHDYDALQCNSDTQRGYSWLRASSYLFSSHRSRRPRKTLSSAFCDQDGLPPEKRLSRSKMNSPTLSGARAVSA